MAKVKDSEEKKAGVEKTGEDLFNHQASENEFNRSQ